MINKYLALGHLSADPDYRQFNSGKSKTSFSLGINYGKETVWIQVECWDKVAENANNFLKKGSLIFIEGKMKNQTWKDDSGKSRSKLICVCEFFKLINVPSNKNSIEKHNVQDIINSEVNKNENAVEEKFEDAPW